MGLLEMATYAIGDIQGCFDTLQKLLKKIDFSPDQDQLWLTGDLINRGPKNLEVLRWAQSLGDAIRISLGNHDLHFIARGLDLSAPKKRDTLEDLLEAPDLEELLAYLRRQPLLHRKGNWVMIHGGLAPEWDIDSAETLAREAEAMLQSKSCETLLKTYYNDPSLRWSWDLKGLARSSAFLKILTRSRICHRNGEIDFNFKGPLSEIPKNYFPWFEVPGRKSATHQIIFGHWAALGLHIKANIYALDTGCVWGRQLTALRLDDYKIFQVNAVE